MTLVSAIDARTGENIAENKRHLKRKSRFEA